MRVIKSDSRLIMQLKVKAVIIELVLVIFLWLIHSSLMQVVTSNLF